MYDTNSEIKSSGVLTGDQLTSFTSGAPKPIPGFAVRQLCDQYGVNSDVVYAQMRLETGSGTSQFWVQRNNPGGIGAVDSHPDAAYWFNTPSDGVRAHIAHLLTYTDGDSNPLASDDPRFALVQHRGDIATIGQMGNGVWATDPDYAGKIVRLANEMLTRYNVSASGGNVVVAPATPTPGVTPTGGSMVPDQSYSLPVRLDLQNNAHSFPDRPTNPDGRILAIVKHVTAGEDLDGALSWNRNPNVKASAHFYIAKDGETVQDVSLFNGAWSNGVLQNDTLPAQFDEVKSNGWLINDFTISIEHVGNPDDADFPTDAQFTADARLTADLCDYYKIPVDTDHILGHNRFDAVDRPNCPGPHWDFDADVRRVSYLLNGGNNGTESTQQPATQPGTVGGSSSNPPTTGSNSGDARPSSGDTGSSNGTNSSGVKPADASNQRPNESSRQHIGVAEYADDNPTGDGPDRTGRGVTVYYPGNDTGIRIGHGFYDQYTANGGLVGGYNEYGTPRCGEFIASVPQVGPDPATFQVFDNAVLYWRAGMDKPARVASGILAARYMQNIGATLPFDFRW